VSLGDEGFVHQSGVAKLRWINLHKIPPECTKSYATFRKSVLWVSPPDHRQYLLPRDGEEREKRGDETEECAGVMDVTERTWHRASTSTR